MPIGSPPLSTRSALSGRFLVAAVTLVAMCVAGQGAPAALPAGAKARLGTGLLYHRYARALALAPDGRRLASISDDALRLWDVATGRPAAKALRLGKKDKPLAVGFTPKGRLLVLVTERHLWQLDPRRGKLRRRVSLGTAGPGPGARTGWDQAVIAPDGRRVVLFGHAKRSVRLSLLDPTNGRLAAASLVLPTNGSWPRLAFAADGTAVAVGQEKTITIVSVPSLKRRTRLSIPGSRANKSCELYDLALESRDGPLWVRAYFDSGSHVIEWPRLGRPSRRPRGLQKLKDLYSLDETLFGRDPKRSCLVSQGAYMLSGCPPLVGKLEAVARTKGFLGGIDNGVLRLWRSPAGRELHVSRGGHVADVERLRALGSKELLTLGADQVLRRWTRAGRLRAEIALPRAGWADPGVGAQLRLAVSANGRSAVVFSERQAVAVPLSRGGSASGAGKPRRLVVKDRSPMLRAAAVSPDGALIAVADAGDLELFAAATGKRVARLRLPLTVCLNSSDCDQVARFSRDGKLLAVGVFAASTPNEADTGGRVVVIDVKTRQRLRKLSVPSLARTSSAAGDDTTRVRAVAFDPSARTVAALAPGLGERVRLLRWELASGRALDSWELPLADAAQLDVGRRAITVAGSRGALTLNPKTGKTLRCRQPRVAPPKSYYGWTRALDGNARAALFARRQAGASVLLWRSKSCALAARAPRKPSKAPKRIAHCPTWRRAEAGVRWTTQVKLTHRRAIAGLLAKSFPKSERIPFCKKSADCVAGRRRPKNCREHLALKDAGYYSDGPNYPVGDIDTLHDTTCRPLALLARAKAAKRSHLRGLRLDRVSVSKGRRVPQVLQILPSLAVFRDVRIANMKKKHPVPWIKAERRVAVSAYCATKVEVQTPLDETTVTLLARGDFNGDGLEDVLLEVYLSARRGGGSLRTTGLYLMTRDKPGAVLRLLRSY